MLLTAAGECYEMCIILTIRYCNKLLEEQKSCVRLFLRLLFRKVHWPENETEAVTHAPHHFMMHVGTRQLLFCVYDENIISNSKNTETVLYAKEVGNVKQRNVT
jgi:hypothetical protein